MAIDPKLEALKKVIKDALASKDDDVWDKVLNFLENTQLKPEESIKQALQILINSVKPEESENGKKGAKILIAKLRSMNAFHAHEFLGASAGQKIRTSQFVVENFPDFLNKEEYEKILFMAIQHPDNIGIVKKLLENFGDPKDIEYLASKLYPEAAKVENNQRIVNYLGEKYPGGKEGLIKKFSRDSNFKLHNFSSILEESQNTDDIFLNAIMVKNNEENIRYLINNTSVSLEAMEKAKNMIRKTNDSELKKQYRKLLGKSVYKAKASSYQPATKSKKGGRLANWLSKKILPAQDMHDTKPSSNGSTRIILNNKRSALPALVAKKQLSYQRLKVVMEEGVELDTVEIRQKGKEASDQQYIVYFLGNNQAYEYNLEEAVEDAHNLGCNAICFNRQNVGFSKGHPPSFDDNVRAGIAQVQRLIDMGVNPEKIVLKGFSMGGAEATYVAKYFHDRGIKVSLFNDRSFSSTAKVGASMVTSNRTGQAILSAILKLIPSSWNKNPAEVFKSIPAGYKEYIVAKASKAEGGKSDERIPHSASVHTALKGQRAASEKTLSDAERIKMKEAIKVRKVYLRQDSKAAGPHSVTLKDLSLRGQGGRTARDFFYDFVKGKNRLPDIERKMEQERIELEAQLRKGSRNVDKDFRKDSATETGKSKPFIFSKQKKPKASTAQEGERESHSESESLLDTEQTSRSDKPKTPFQPHG